MTELVLGLDQGTSSTRCVALDRDLREHGRAQVPVACSFPRPGWVEQDPEALLASALEAIAGAAPAAGLPLGIANQTETFIVWERGSGRAIHPAIVWQDRRTEDACAALRTAGHEPLIRRRTGLELDATFPATKLAWVLDHVDGARAAAQAGELAYGDVACWLTYKLTGEHVTDAGNAGRTLLCPLGGTDWDDELLDLFEIPRVLLPPIVASDALAAPSARAAPGTPRPAAPSARAAPGTPRPVAPSAHDIPRVVASAAPTPRIVAALGDQQASLFGLRCWTPGAAKVTLGTGAFLLVQAGSAPPTPPDGVLASCAWRRGETTSYALEGFVPTAGAAVDWFTRLGALPPARELDALVRTAADDDLVCVPTLQGTGVPTWNPMATGALFGLRLSHTRADLARAVVDGILHQVVDGLEAMTVDVLKVDGGLSRSDWVVQRLADLSGVRVERTSRPDSTALGAAMLAGLAAGLWEAPEAIPEIPVDLVAQPALSAAERSLRRGRWASACELSDQWPQ